MSRAEQRANKLKKKFGKNAQKECENIIKGVMNDPFVYRKNEVLIAWSKTLNILQNG